jgi:hypothetical protein
MHSGSVKPYAADYSLVAPQFDAGSHIAHVAQLLEHPASQRRDIPSRVLLDGCDDEALDLDLFSEFAPSPFRSAHSLPPPPAD